MDIGHAQDLLARERARVEGALGTLVPTIDEDVDPIEAGDAGQEQFQEERDEARAEQLRNELAAIERAEHRIAEGTHGLSVDSGEPIPDARLEAVPWAERTADEQARFEAGG